jgi:hypothetical protein
MLPSSHRHQGINLIAWSPRIFLTTDACSLSSLILQDFDWRHGVNLAGMTNLFSK